MRQPAHQLCVAIKLEFWLWPTKLMLSSELGLTEASALAREVRENCGFDDFITSSVLSQTKQVLSSTINFSLFAIT